jgi:hypothetical protein
MIAADRAQTRQPQATYRNEVRTIPGHATPASTDLSVTRIRHRSLGPVRDEEDLLHAGARCRRPNGPPLGGWEPRQPTQDRTAPGSWIRQKPARHGFLATGWTVRFIPQRPVGPPEISGGSEGIAVSRAMAGEGVPGQRDHCVLRRAAMPAFRRVPPRASRGIQWQAAAVDRPGRRERCTGRRGHRPLPVWGPALPGTGYCR